MIGFVNSQSLKVNSKDLFYYPFEGTNLDRTRYNTSTTNVGAALTWDTLTPMPFSRKCASNLSEGVYFDVSATDRARLANLNAYSIELFFNFKTINSGGDNILYSIAQNGTGVNGVNYIDWVASLNVFVWGVGNGLGNAVQSTGFSVSANTWYYCALTWDGTTRKMYLSPANNISQTPNATKVQAAGFGSTIDQFLIGRYLAPAGSWNVSIKGFRIRSGVAIKFPFTPMN